jgi:uncharacterized membrane protein
MHNTMFNLQNLTLYISTILGALIAGLFYSYSVSVNPGLGKLSDVEYLRAMQSINLAIQNPLFFVSFMGYLIVLPICAWANYTQPMSVTFYLIIAAFAVYAIGVFGVTAMGNVPLNNSLASFKIDIANADMLADMRRKFELPWNSLHSIRTIFCVLSLLLIVAACFQGQRVK